jgi:FixJ family two-component response regulator
MDAMMAGASDFIVKPFEDEKVARTIAQWTS